MAALMLLIEEDYYFFLYYAVIILKLLILLVLNIIYSLITLTLNGKAATLIKLKKFPSGILFMQENDSDKVL